MKKLKIKIQFTSHNLWVAEKKKIMALKAYVDREEISASNNLNFHPGKLEKEEQLKAKAAGERMLHKSMKLQTGNRKINRARAGPSYRSAKLMNLWIDEPGGERGSEEVLMSEINVQAADHMDSNN